jgi:multicomponent Na+:H+ antiporter subunit D
MLAYSSISQIGIIMTGIGIKTDIAVTGALFHIVNHALMKSGLFLCAGIMIHYSGTRKISQLRFKTPGIVVSFVVLSLGIIGIPPLNGFVSKFIICYGAVKAHDTVLVLVILAASLLSCVYYFRVIQTFFKKRRRRNRDTFQVSRSMSFPVYVLAALSVILGLFPLIGLRTIELALQVVMG